MGGKGYNEAYPMHFIIGFSDYILTLGWPGEASGKSRAPMPENQLWLSSTGRKNLDEIYVVSASAEGHS